MPSSDPVQRFEDILTNIARIEEHTGGMGDITAFEENQLVYDAVERCLEWISEASKKLGPAAETLCPNIPWPKIADLETFCGMNTTGLKDFASGTWFKMICRR